MSGVRVVALTGWDIGDTSAISDSAGHYQITGLRDDRGRAIPLQELTALKEGYSQPCRPTIDRWLTGSATEVNIYLVANDVLATGGTPPLLPVSGPILSGTVFERGSDRGDPVAGAEVVVDFNNGFIISAPARGARTVTDAAGRYILCGLTQPYRVFWDEGGEDFAEGSAYVLSRRATDTPVTRLRVDVRVLSHLDIEVD